MELISKEEVFAIMDKINESHTKLEGTPIEKWATMCIEINSLPTIEERKEGRWIDHKRLIMTDPEIWGYSQECSICGFVFGAKEYNFCPNCGARMKGE